MYMFKKKKINSPGKQTYPTFSGKRNSSSQMPWVEIC